MIHTEVWDKRSLVMGKDTQTDTHHHQKKNVFLILEAIVAGGKLGPKNHRHHFLAVPPGPSDCPSLTLHVLLSK